jgi:hypothetical protein
VTGPKGWLNQPLKKRCSCGHWAASHVRADVADRHCSECECKSFGSPLTERQLWIKSRLTFLAAVALVFSIAEYVASLINHTKLSEQISAVAFFLAVILTGVAKLMVGG